MADETQQHIQEAEARGVQRMKRIDIDGSIVFDTIEQAKEILKEFKSSFGLE